MCVCLIVPFHPGMLISPCFLTLKSANVGCNSGIKAIMGFLKLDLVRERCQTSSVGEDEHVLAIEIVSPLPPTV